MEHVVDALHRQFERVGGDLREHRLDALPDRRRADEHRDLAVGLDEKPRILPRPGAAAFEIAADGDAVVAAVDQRALQLRPLGPVEFGEAAIERHLIIAAVAFADDVEHMHLRQRIGHVGFGDQIAAAEFDAVDAEIGRHHVEQPLAAEIRLEAARPAIGARRRLVGHHHGHVHAHMGDAIGPGHDLRNIARRGGAVGAHIGAEIGIGVAAQREDGAVAAAGDFEIACGIARVAERHQILAPVLGPLHRAADDTRRERNQKILRIKFAARAETAADVVFQHAHRCLGQLHHLRQRAAVVERHLADAGDRHALFRGVPVGDQAARLHRHRAVALHLEMLAADVRRILERRIGVAARGRDGAGDVAAGFFEQENIRPCVRRRGRPPPASGSISTAIASNASSASATLSATTTAIGSPTKRTLSAAMIGCT